NGGHQFNPYRAISTIRQFFQPSSSQACRYFNAQSLQEQKPIAIVGAKNCDLYSLKIQDYVFLGEPVDQVYKARRDSGLIISSDCSDFKDVCFCLNLGLNPYPDELFDLNLSKTEGGYFLEAGSAKGEKLLEKSKSLFQEKKTASSEREESRQGLIDRLTGHLNPQQLAPKEKLHQLIKDGFQHDVWAEQAQKCVECGACIMNCPTCHCFLLLDEEKQGEFFRGKIWDGCQYRDFARVAGGANPLRLRSQRLRNRYVKKFEFFKENMDLYACTGCGRCIEGCLAKIDIRDIFKQLNAVLNKRQ
ncbi:4Fe-4S dicluster domain-containing protein, partial [Candidatus Omnitrophota bacterium]